MLKLSTICLLLLIGEVSLNELSYYEILGISKHAPAQEIRQAYKKLAVKFHPDKNPNKIEQDRFLKITESYETLKDPEKRRHYDLYGNSQTYSRKYDYQSQKEYNNLYYNGLYHRDPFVDTLSSSNFYEFLGEGFHFVNFYSPFCPPCQSLVEHWKKLAELYKGIVKIGAVNCKHHNSFCYNSMKINSYPSLLFFPNGKHGNFIYYRGDRVFEQLDQFLINYVSSRVHIANVVKIRSTERPIAYMLGENRLDSNCLTRIAYHLNGLVTVVQVTDETIREQLTQNEYATAVFKYKDITNEIVSTDEKDILREIVNALPRIEVITPDKIKEIRQNLRKRSGNTFVLYFSKEGEDRLLLNQLRLSYPEIDFGEIDCEKWNQLCLSLQADATPSWGLLKKGGAYQKAPSSVDIRNFIFIAGEALNLHTLSISEFLKISNGEIGVWVVLVVPYQTSWEHIINPFTRTSLHYTDSDISFGIITCSISNDKHCREMTDVATIVLLDGKRRNVFEGAFEESEIKEYIDLIKDSKGLELDEQQMLEILDVSNREYWWLVAYLPDCGAFCDQLEHQWRIVAKKLRPLDFVRVGILKCPRSDGFCTNVKSPTARLYPVASGLYYTISLKNLSEAPYILEWALGLIDDSVKKFSWQTFSTSVVAEELRPVSFQKPWLVYFHSPRCYRCYEMYADFAIAGILLNNAVQLGKVNCVTDRNVCTHEQITSYPSLKLYLKRNGNQRFSSIISVPIQDYVSMVSFIRSHLIKYDENLLRGVDLGVLGQSFGLKHDEL